MSNDFKSARHRYAALCSWGNTADRSSRTAAARRESPASIEYFLRRLDVDQFANAGDAARVAAAEALRRAHFLDLAARSAVRRRRSAFTPPSTAEDQAG